MDERKPRHRRGPRRSRNHQESRHGSRGGLSSRLALQLAQPDSFRRRRRGFRGTHPHTRHRPAQSPNARRLAQSFPPVAFPLRRGFRPGRSLPPQSRAGNGPHLLPSGPAPRPIAAGRNAHHQQPDRPSFAHAARRFRPSLRSAFRLGPRPEKSSAQIFSPAPRSPRHHAHRPPLRRGHSRPRRHCPRAHPRRSRRAPAFLLIRPQGVPCQRLASASSLRSSRGSAEIIRKIPAARNQIAVLPAVAFQYRLVKGPGRNAPVAHAMIGHTPSKIPTQASMFAPRVHLEMSVPIPPAIMETPSISQETRPIRMTTSWFAESAYHPVSGVSRRTIFGATNPSKTNVTAHAVAARVMAVVAIRVHPLRSLQNEPAPISHSSGPARINP